MKKRLVLKPFVLPTLYIIMIVALVFFTSKILYKDSEPKDNDLDYVSETIFENIVPVIDEEEIVLNPYSGENVTVKIGYYNYQSESDNQEKSIIQYENTYLQNTGLSYNSDKEFKVVAVMKGEVTKVYNNDLLGNVVEISHDNNIITVYQTVDNVKVKAGDVVMPGQEIATSGTSKLFSIGNNFHFEVLKNGIVNDPNNILGKNVKDV